MALAVIIASLVSLVNPFVGTDGHGHTFPGATYPFGMIQLSPDTRLDGWDGCSGYHYSDSSIYGFSHTHLSGTGCADYCDILLMPVAGCRSIPSNEKYKSVFSHSNEKAEPGYYSVFLDKWKVSAELTCGKRSAMHRYTFDNADKPQIVLDLTHRDLLIGSQMELSKTGYTITGYRQSKSWADNQMLYYYIEFSEPIKSFKKNKSETALISFAKNNNTILVKVGVSSVSIENAKLNLESEVSDWNFDNLRASTAKAWNDYLSKIEVTSDNLEQKKVFYTALYHTAISPNIYSDVNGQYRGHDGKIHTADGYEQYTVFSLWDTYRALHPLFTIIERDRTLDFIKSFLSIYQYGHKLPIWELSANETNCMIGYHSVAVIADALAKSIDDFDIDSALKAMIVSSNLPEVGIDVYSKNGLVLAEKEHESVSKTLEYAYDDWCIAQVARNLAKREMEKVIHKEVKSFDADDFQTIRRMLDYEDIYSRYIQRAQYYKNVFDPQSRFMRPRTNGVWLSPFDPTEINVHYTEGNSWQYSFSVPQDFEGYTYLYGGEEEMIEHLDNFFSISSATSGWKSADVTGLIGQYAQGNEPSHHIAYLYSYLGQPWKTQKIVRQIVNTFFSSSADGLCGNEDCGQMSAWYVFSALGFYPVLPGSDQYVLGSPLFEKATIHLENGKDFTINTTAEKYQPVNIEFVEQINLGGNDGNTETYKESKYIQHVLRNSADYVQSYITHSDIMDGIVYDIYMGAEPNIEFGSKYFARPISKIAEKFIVINPWFKTDKQVFTDSTIVEIRSISPQYSIAYAFDEPNSSLPDSLLEYHLYEKPIVVSSDCTIKAYCSDTKGNRSHISSISLNKYESDYTIDIKSEHNPQYYAGGDNGLIDGIRGKLNFRLGDWHGYQNVDFEAVIDLHCDKSISSISAGFLQDAASWIWMPKYAEFFISKDGKKFVSVGKVKNSVDAQDYRACINDFTINFKTPIEASYIKVFAKQFGTIPKWHLGAGGESFIFIDEIFIK